MSGQDERSSGPGRLGIKYELREYMVDPDDLSAEKVAAKIGFPLERLFKTLVVRGDRHGICLAVIPANAELDFKALARQTGDRKVRQGPIDVWTVGRLRASDFFRPATAWKTVAILVAH